jgi:hypothetical protein
MEMDADVSARRAHQMEAVERFIHTTPRTDWDALVAELFDRVIYRCPYGIAAVTKRKIVRWHRLVIRVNDLFEPIEAPLFVRNMLRVGHYDAIFKSTEGMERHERYDLYKIVDARLGLPVKSLVYGIQHLEKPELRCLLVFGGERLEGQMERSLELVQKILAASATNQRHPPPAPGQDDFGGYGELIAELRDINVKELDKLDIRAIADLVNGLDAVIEYSPAALRAKHRAMNDYLLNRRRNR